MERFGTSGGARYLALCKWFWICPRLHYDNLYEIPFNPILIETDEKNHKQSQSNSSDVSDGSAMHTDWSAQCVIHDWQWETKTLPTTHLYISWLNEMLVRDASLFVFILYSTSYFELL